MWSDAWCFRCEAMEKTARTRRCLARWASCPEASGPRRVRRRTSDGAKAPPVGPTPVPPEVPEKAARFHASEFPPLPGRRGLLVRHMHHGCRCAQLPAFWR